MDIRRVAGVLEELLELDAGIDSAKVGVEAMDLGRRDYRDETTVRAADADVACDPLACSAAFAYDAECGAHVIVISIDAVREHVEEGAAPSFDFGLHAAAQGARVAGLAWVTYSTLHRWRAWGDSRAWAGRSWQRMHRLVIHWVRVGVLRLGAE